MISLKAWSYTVAECVHAANVQTMTDLRPQVL